MVDERPSASATSPENLPSLPTSARIFSPMAQYATSLIMAAVRTSLIS